MSIFQWEEIIFFVIHFSPIECTSQGEDDASLATWFQWRSSLQIASTIHTELLTMLFQWVHQQMATSANILSHLECLQMSRLHLRVYSCLIRVSLFLILPMMSTISIMPFMHVLWYLSLLFSISITNQAYPDWALVYGFSSSCFFPLVSQYCLAQMSRTHAIWHLMTSSFLSTLFQALPSVLLQVELTLACTPHPNLLTHSPCSSLLYELFILHSQSTLLSAQTGQGFLLS